MRILEINKLYHPVIGGIETIVKLIAENLDKDKFTVDVLVCQEKASKRKVESINGVKVYRAASFGKKLGMPLSFDFFKLFFSIKNNYDLIIIHHPFPLASLLSPFIAKDKLITYYHSDIIRQKLAYALFYPFIKLNLKRSKSILVASNNLIQYSKLLKKFKNKARHLAFGLDIEYGKEDFDLALKIKKEYSKHTPLLLAVGRLVYYKGFKELILAMQGVEAKLIIIGTGPQEKKLKELIKVNKLEDRIEILATLENLAPFFLASDIFLFPSTHSSEAFGLVQIEALAASCPIINTRLNTGVEEVSIDNESGLTITPGNIEELRGAILKLINDTSLRKKFSSQARLRYDNLYRLENFINKLEQIISET